MVRERTPIATRTRNRTKSQDSHDNSSVASPPPPTAVTIEKTSSSSKHSNKKADKTRSKKSRKHRDKDRGDKASKEFQYHLPYLPKSNLDLYLQELNQLPSSFIRGTTAEQRRAVLRHDQDSYYDTSHLNPDSESGKRVKKRLAFLNDENVKAKEYSMCLHRAFIKKRYFSDQECMHLARYVNCDFYTQSLQELAMLIKDELYMYRLDFTQRHLHHIRTMNITEQAFLENEKGLEKVLEQQLNEDYLRYFWGRWIIEPFVDPVSFFAISKNKDLLAKITAKTMIEHLKYFFNIISTKRLDEELKKMDKISIAIILPS